MKQKEFIEKAISIHGNKFTYELTNYKKLYGHETVINCNKHGKFTVKNANEHLKSRYGGCRHCYKAARQDKFIEKAIMKYDNKYDYSKVKFINDKEKVEIICPVHGSFMQSPKNHLRPESHGCTKCGIESSIKHDNLSKTRKEEAIVYVIRCFCLSEEFYKLGYTSTSVKKRFCNNEKMPYSYDIMAQIKLPNAKLFEQIAHNELFRYKYTPRIKFEGCTECYRTNPLEHFSSIYKKACTQ